MRLLVFGATGRTGRRVITEALSRKLEVGAFVRDASRVADVEVHVGDVTDAAAVKRAVRAGDVFITTLGGPSMSEGTRVITEALAAVGTRLLGVVGAGILQWDDTTLRNQHPSYPERLRTIGAEHQRVHDVLASSGLSWLLVCTPLLVDGEAKGTMVSKADYLPDGSGQVTTGDVAALLVREAVEPTLSMRVGVNS